MHLTTLKRETMGEQLAEMLRASILSGAFEPGATVTETALALRFGASRGPIRDAMRRLIDEGLLVSVPYTGTRVLGLSARDVDEIYAMRICLEIFAFEQVWDDRTPDFRDALLRRHDTLIAAIDALDDIGAISAELDLHGLAYEACGNSLLLASWNGIRARLQLYWATHHRAHGIVGPKRESHEDYVRLALGDDLDRMRDEIRSHMRRGLETTTAFVASLEEGIHTDRRKT